MTPLLVVTVAVSWSIALTVIGGSAVYCFPFDALLEQLVLVPPPAVLAVVAVGAVVDA